MSDKIRSALSPKFGDEWDRIFGNRKRIRGSDIIIRAVHGRRNSMGQEGHRRHGMKDVIVAIIILVGGLTLGYLSGDCQPQAQSLAEIVRQ